VDDEVHVKESVLTKKYFKKLCKEYLIIQGINIDDLQHTAAKFSLFSKILESKGENLNDLIDNINIDNAENRIVSALTSELDGRHEQ
jgi:hypothetical protein